MAKLQLFQPNAKKQSTALQVAVFQSETMAVFEDTMPHRSFNVFYVLTGMLGLLLLLMSVVTIDRVVTGTGKIVPLEGPLLVQPLQLSIVKEIKVRKGDIVHKGQVLALLDPTFAAADLKQGVNHGVATHALLERLQAEFAGRTYTPSAGDSDGVLQLGIFNQRMTEYRQGVQNLESQISSQQAVLASAESDVRKYRQESAIADRIHGMRSELEAKGFGSKLDTLVASNTSTEVQRLESDAINAADQARQTVGSLRAQLQVFKSHWHDDIGTQIAAAKDDLNTTNATVAKASKINDLIQLVAPKDAVVLSIGDLSVGSIVDPTIQSATKPLFTLTPLGGTLEAEIHIPSKDIGFVQKGQKVMLKLDAYDFLIHSTAEGKIIELSEGSFTTDENGNPIDPYFKARVRIEKTDLKGVPKDFRLIPGMTLTGDVLVGHRTILYYLLSGATRASKEAMREPN